jgi:hypothetical protein
MLTTCPSPSPWHLATLSDQALFRGPLGISSGEGVLPLPSPGGSTRARSHKPALIANLFEPELSHFRRTRVITNLTPAILMEIAGQAGKQVVVSAVGPGILASG